MKMKALICVLLALCLAGCGAKAESATNEMVADRYYGALYDSADSSMEKAPEISGNTTSSVVTTQQKLVRTMTIDAETNDMDQLLTDINGKIQSLGGYMESKSIRNGSSNTVNRYRYGSMTIRVPADRLDEFVEHISGESNVVHYNETTDDITLRYVATKSRITALETEQQRLLELLGQAKNMSDLLQIEERLTSVRAELEEVTSQMRIYDNMVDYGTIHLNITEVQVYTPVQEQTVWQKIGSGLKENWNGLCVAVENLFVFVITSLPYTIPLTGVVVLIVLFVKKRKKRKQTQMKTE